MLEEIKKELIEHPNILKDVLEYFGYRNIITRPKYIQCGRDEKSSKKSITIKLENNKYLYVNDWARNIQQDLFSYIMNQKKVEFSDILNVIKMNLGISNYYDFFEHNTSIFGGFYDNVKNNLEHQMMIYDKSILDKYANYGNLRFLRDNISLETQRFFNIRYDIENQGIIIPIYNQIGEIIGIKIRCNWDVSDGEQKYYYLISCPASLTLYGYSQNYKFLQENTIFIFESEKSVMQCHSYGIRNCVALGSSSISLKQVEMLLELNPQRIIFMHDTGFKFEYIKRNINTVKNYSRFNEIEIGYWDYFDKQYKNKISPSDLGKKELKRIIKHELKMVGDDSEEL